MDSRPFDETNTNKYFVVNKDISIVFKEAANLKKLEAGFNGECIEICPGTLEETEGLCHRWNIGREIPMFPNFDDTFFIRATYTNGRKLLKREKSESFRLTCGDIGTEFEAQVNKSGMQKAIAIYGETLDWRVRLEVTVGDIEDARVLTVPFGNLDTLLPEQIRGIVASGNSFLENAKSLESVFEDMRISDNTLQVLDNAIENLKNAHPLAKAVLTALTIPYELMKTEHEFIQKVKDVVFAMQSACKCLMDARYHTKIESAIETFVSIMKTLRDVALYLSIYRAKSRFGRFCSAQFPRELEKYAEVLVMKKNDFQMTMIMQIVRDVDKMASMTDMDFIRRRLDPVKAVPHGESCMEGTRVKILQGVREWIKDFDSERNILWVVGAPGSGKSTIATTIAAEVEDKLPLCATFFCDRDIPFLSDPRRIWPTLACSLADKHGGVKADLMNVLDRKKGEPRNDTVLKQYQQLVEGPLQTDLKETSFRSHRNPYPLIIIDALDECFSSEDANWDSLLESLILWAKLSPVFKLIITSREFIDIRETLGEASHRVDLSVGDNVSDDSKHDVGTFFVEKFERMKKRQIGLHLCPDWPEKAQLGKLTDYAAGLFIWADMVVKYVGLRSGGSNPIKRLDDVLNDIKTLPGEHPSATRAPDGRGQVDHLYARIIFEALRRSQSDERVEAKKILATILLAKETLLKSDLAELLSSHNSKPLHVLISIESTLQELGPIIIVSEPEGEVRLCHKSVSDFLLSHDRSVTALKSAVENWNSDVQRKRWDAPISDLVLDCKMENRRLTLACLRLASGSLSEDIDSVARLMKQSSGSFFYARRYWLGHFQDASIHCGVLVNLENLANAAEVAFRCLRRHTARQILAKEEAMALTKAIQEAFDFVRSFINHERPEVEVFQRRLDQFTKNIDIARGHFQISMVMNLAQDINKSAQSASDLFLQKRLSPSDHALLDSECLEGTRVNVLRRANDWLHGSNQRNILWVVGAPGTGKSSIATTLVKEFSKSRLCANFFVKRDFVTRSDPARLWRSLAYELASLHSGFRGSIMEALLDLEKSCLPRDAVDDQLRILLCITKSLEDQQSLSVVFVIDALDECFAEDNEQWRALLETITHCAKLPQSFRLIITSREIPEIRLTLADISNIVDLSSEDADSILETNTDVQEVLRARLVDVLKGSEDTYAYWLQPNVTHQLAEYAAGSFIWAELVVGLVKLQPKARVEDILSCNELRNARSVDVLYAKVLYGVLGQLHNKERNAYRSLLAFVVLAKNPLCVTDLATLLSSSIDHEDETLRLVDAMTKELSSIISVDDGTRLLRIPRKPFVDFVLDQERSFKAMACVLGKDQDPSSYLIDRERDSVNIAIACLRLLSCSLKFNVCQIKTSCCLDSDISEQAGHISRSISPSIIYASCFWAEHLKDCNVDHHGFRTLVQPHLQTVLCEKLLYWLEVLSLTKSMSSVEKSLEIVFHILESYITGAELAEVAKDALLFVQKFQAPIVAAVPHIYLSALPFCPSDSWVTRLYGSRYTNLLSVISGRQTNWHVAASSTREAHEMGVTGVAFFPEGTKLASGSADNSCRTWDVDTGRALSAQGIEWHTKVCCIAVSPSGGYIASGGDKGSLRIWDTGSNSEASPIGPISAHNRCIWSVAFSPDGSRIATGSKDHTVNVWDVTTGNLCLGPLIGHSDDVRSVTFSPDATCIASGSDDKTIRIWDVCAGNSQRSPLRLTLAEHTDWVRCVAFTANGRYLASSSDDETIRLWDVSRAFVQISVTRVGNTVRSIAFAPDSNSLVSGSDDGAIRFWSVRSGSCEQIGGINHAHAGTVRSVAFAPDGLSVASGADDCAIKIWRVSTNGSYSSESRDGKSLESASLDLPRSSPLGDDSFIDKDGWMRTSRQDGADVLFWVPEENRRGFLWPRNTTVILPTVTEIDFRRFVYGDRWTDCRSSVSVAV